MSRFFQALERVKQERLMYPEVHERDGSSETSPEPKPRIEEPKSLSEAEPPPNLEEPRILEKPAARGVDAADRPPARTATIEGVDEHLVSLLAPASMDAEPYRGLRYTMEQLRKEHQLQVLGITSPKDGDGKTTTAINLAGAFAQSRDARMLLVDLDFYAPSVGTQLGLDDAIRPGITRAITDSKVALKDVVYLHPGFNLSVLAIAEPPRTPHELLWSDRLGELLDEARREFDYVVLDMAPVLPPSDCRAISRWVDGLLLVVAAGRTPRKLVAESLNLMDSDKVVGIVFNNDEHPFSVYSIQRPNGNGAKARSA